MESLRDKNRKPTHGGAILREDMLPALNITQGELAVKLGVSRRTISEILHEKRPITADMAIRIAKFYQHHPAKLAKHAANARYLAATAN